LKAAPVEFLIGGAYSLALYTGIERDTKDLDVFVRPQDRDRALEALVAAGFQAEVTYSHWLAKAFRGDFFIDVIYNCGNGAAPIDDDWFRHAPAAEVCGESVRLCPAEESIWSKAFIMERDRYDGADIAHILCSAGGRLDWRRLLDRFGPSWRVLYSHLILFGFIYPAERDRIPGWVLRELYDRFQSEPTSAPAERLCRGTLLSATQYRPDVERWGYRDARLRPHGTLTPEQVAVWTDGVLTGR
jgi:hypothetical protein